MATYTEEHPEIAKKLEDIQPSDSKYWANKIQEEEAVKPKQDIQHGKGDEWVNKIEEEKAVKAMYDR